MKSLDQSDTIPYDPIGEEVVLGLSLDEHLKDLAGFFDRKFRPQPGRFRCSSPETR